MTKHSISWDQFNIICDLSQRASITRNYSREKDIIETAADILGKEVGFSYSYPDLGYPSAVITTSDWVVTTSCVFLDHQNSDKWTGEPTWSMPLQALTGDFDVFQADLALAKLSLGADIE